MEVGERDKIMQGGITTTMPYPFQDKGKRIIRCQILILNHQANAQRSRRNEKEPMENSKVSRGRRKN